MILQMLPQVYSYHCQGINCPRRNGFVLVVSCKEVVNEEGKPVLNDCISGGIHQRKKMMNIVHGEPEDDQSTTNDLRRGIFTSVLPPSLLLQGDKRRLE
jgi:hypothetical protein